MFKFIFSLGLFQQLDPRIYELQKEVEFYRILLSASVLVIFILTLAVVLQRIFLEKMRKPGNKSVDDPESNNSSVKDRSEKKIKKTIAKGVVDSKNLPDPGLIFRYSLARGDVTGKLITIGQTEGNIKTYSTEIINDHLNVHIRILNNRSEKDLNNLPDSIYEEYMIDLRRGGEALICYPGLEAFRPMGVSERIYIMKEADPAGDPAFRTIDPKQPVRIRLGERLNQNEKFVNGYFEFHIFNQEYEVKTDAGITKYENNFLLRLYRIYPGYDISSPGKDGLYPMMAPFSMAGK